MMPAISAMLAALVSITGQATAEVTVVVTSKPVHALVADVMRGVGEPALLVDGTASPHTYAMRPSDAQRVAHARIVFRVSETLEPFTARLWKALPASATAVTLADVPGVRLLKRRAGGSFEAASRAGTSDRLSRHVAHDHDRAGDHTGYDPHIWLDPDNAKAMAAAIAVVLSQAMPAATEQFEGNAAALARRLDAMAGSIVQELKPVAGRPFVVLHDAYQYFEQRFGLDAIGSISVSPEEQPSARRLSDLRRKVQALSAVCVFAEPQIQQRVVTSVIEGTSARTGILDPEGVLLEKGPDLYVQLMTRLSHAIRACLAGES